MVSPLSKVVTSTPVVTPTPTLSLSPTPTADYNQIFNLPLTYIDSWTNIISICLSLVSLVAIYLSVKALVISRRTLQREAFVDLLNDYKSDEMQNAIQKLQINFRKDKNFIKKYEKSLKENYNSMKGIAQVMFHKERKVVSKFYQTLAALKKNKILNDKFI